MQEMRFLLAARRVTNTESAKKVMPPNRSLRFVFVLGEAGWANCAVGGDDDEGAGIAERSVFGFS